MKAAAAQANLEVGPPSAVKAKAEDEARLREARNLIAEVNLGATAIGTGINRFNVRALGGSFVGAQENRLQALKKFRAIATIALF